MSILLEYYVRINKSNKEVLNRKFLEQIKFKQMEEFWRNYVSTG